MELPKFKYHPNPLATGAIAESSEVCECCEKARGYMYKASFYTAEEVESICPWCIADGSAAEKYEGRFTDEHPLISAGISTRKVGSRSNPPSVYVQRINILGAISRLIIGRFSLSYEFTLSIKWNQK